ncbi:MAG: hypothetical protein HYR56_23565 [Acidobacteria bacterium]|nr:hypothetical protein [Acidobacteriota bacterium]MBI3426259.1 hypothetical protein [Acidobacteriota bacterium]
MLRKLPLGGLLCLLLSASAIYQHSAQAQQKAKTTAATEKGLHLKLLRRLEREHFGASLADAMRRHPAAGKAFEVVGITATPKKGFSFWNAEGSVLVVLDYDPDAGAPPPSEVVLAPLETLDPYDAVIISLCCCPQSGTGAEAGCEVDSKAGGSVGKCFGKDCCGQAVAVLKRGGATTVHGAGCFAAAK